MQVSWVDFDLRQLAHYFYIGASEKAGIEDEINICEPNEVSRFSGSFKLHMYIC